MSFKSVASAQPARSNQPSTQPLLAQPHQHSLLQSGLSRDGRTVPARCAFMIAPLTPDVDTSVPVAFGEGFKLICANELQDDGSGFLGARPRCYLGSCRLSERYASRMSNRQVTFDDEPKVPRDLNRLRGGGCTYW